MIKISGMAALLISSVIMGFIMSAELSERTKALKEICKFAAYIKTDLEYRAANIEDCFKMRGRLFSNAYDYITKDNMLPTPAVIKACDNIGFLQKEDREIIRAYSENLNAENIEGQIANIEWLINNLNIQIRESEAEYTTKSRLYRSGGVMLGLGAVILLL